MITPELTEAHRLYLEVVEHLRQDPGVPQETAQEALGHMLAYSMDVYGDQIDRVSIGQAVSAWRRSADLETVRDLRPTNRLNQESYVKSLERLDRDGLVRFQQPITLDELAKEPLGLVPMLLMRSLLCGLDGKNALGNVHRADNTNAGKQYQRFLDAYRSLIGDITKNHQVD